MAEVIELESAKLMEQFSADHQNFVCVRHAALHGKRHYQVISLPKGFASRARWNLGWQPEWEDYREGTPDRNWRRSP